MTVTSKVADGPVTSIHQICSININSSVVFC